MKIIIGMLLLMSLESLQYVKPRFSIAVHGGAGSYLREKFTKEKEMITKQGILEALKTGYEILKKGGHHLVATEEAIMKLEDNPIFNAGKGAKINEEFEVELDASIMDGSNLKCGAVGNSKHIKNPIKGARLIMEKTKHLLLAGPPVDRYAEKEGLEIVNNTYFFTEERIKEWEDARKENLRTDRMGTVGAVVIDHNGNLAAATSTGGTTYKMAGRIGDSPIIGAGNYANNESVAVSCTGTGEIFMRNLIAYDIHARMTYKNISLKQTVQEIFKNLESDSGGFIAVDKNYNIEMPYNSPGMARGYVKENGKAYIYIFGDGQDLTPVEYDLNAFEEQS